jgi:hypothetical protein
MNQQAKDGPCQLLRRTQEEGKEHLSRNCSRKQKRFPTAIVEYGEKEVRELLDLERPQKKKDNSKLMCFNCNELGHYANKCLEKDNKANSPGSMKKNLNHITCYTCKKQGHYSYQCTEESTSRPQ